MPRVIVNIDVPDLARAIAFYRDAVGLTPVRVLDGDVAELVGESCTLYLLYKPAGTLASKLGGDPRHYDRHWTPVHVDFVVPDVEAAAERAIAAGAVRESATVEWLGSKCITFSDVFGHGFCLIEFAASGYLDSVPIGEQ
jgi:catechol 2,3-dioxygenase-like lactoylglutathione lyase family enzyme